jgi:hypothetical protein
MGVAACVRQGVVQCWHQLAGLSRAAKRHRRGRARRRRGGLGFRLKFDGKMRTLQVFRNQTLNLNPCTLQSTPRVLSVRRFASTSVRTHPATIRPLSLDPRP